MATSTASVVSASGCVNGAPYPRVSGIGHDTGNMDGVEAKINPPGGADVCTHSLGNDAVSAWVALVPDSSPNQEAILQIGVIKQNYPGGTDGLSWQYFWAQGGCGLITDPATAEVLGPADAGPHIYTIAKDTSYNEYWLYIDDIPQKVISASDSRISCWINNNKGTQVAGETHDGGDHFSIDSPTTTADKMRFRDITFHRSGTTGWYSLNWGPGNCTATDSTIWDHRCNTTAAFPDGFYLWSVLK